MSYMKLLSDRADIYHLDITSSTGGYGLPGEDVFSYPSTPDATSVPCYLVKQASSVKQTDSMAIVSGNWLAHFQYGTDIRRGDKIVINGFTFQAQIPRPIKQHHIECELELEDAL